MSERFRRLPGGSRSEAPRSIVPAIRICARAGRSCPSRSKSRPPRAAHPAGPDDLRDAPEASSRSGPRPRPAGVSVSFDQRTPRSRRRRDRPRRRRAAAVRAEGPTARESESGAPSPRRAARRSAGCARRSVSTAAERGAAEHDATAPAVPRPPDAATNASPMRAQLRVAGQRRAAQQPRPVAGNIGARRTVTRSESGRLRARRDSAPVLS